MATTTTRLTLRKPATSDNVNVTTDISDNMDKLDTAASFERLSSNPGSPFTGKSIHRSDLNDLARFYNGTKWIDLDHRTKYVRKTADETINNVGSVQDDDHLLITDLEVSTVYFVECLFFWTGASDTSNIKFKFNYPAGWSFKWIPMGLGPSQTSEEGTVRCVAETAGGERTLASVAATEIAATPTGILRTDASTGTFKLQWSQSPAVAENTTLKTDSIMVFHRL